MVQTERSGRTVINHDKICNLTDSTCNVYQKGSGDIIEIKPKIGTIPEVPNAEKAYYIVPNDIVEDAIKRNRPLVDLLVVGYSGPGRHDIIMTTLYTVSNDYRQAVEIS